MVDSSQEFSDNTESIHSFSLAHLNPGHARARPAASRRKCTAKELTQSGKGLDASTPRDLTEWAAIFCLENQTSTQFPPCHYFSPIITCPLSATNSLSPSPTTTIWSIGHLQFSTPTTQHTQQSRHHGMFDDNRFMWNLALMEFTSSRPRSRLVSSGERTRRSSPSSSRS